MDRRNFIKSSVAAMTALPWYDSGLAAGMKAPDTRLHISVFSKHLQFLPYQEMSKMAAQIGFDGVDLTVRPNGHVLPEQVEQDLPRAVEAINKAGVESLMMATAVNDAVDPTGLQVLKTAAALGIKYYRMGYFRYTREGDIPSDISVFQKRAGALGSVNGELGLIGCYQNHAGNYVGASIFELYEIFRQADQQATGLQYDIRHATVEGGKSWETGLRLIKDRIKTIVLKDFRWEKINGVWDAINTPLGEGMVDFKKYFSLLKKYGVNVPVTMHFEYPMGGAEHGDREISTNPDEIFKAMRRDLEYARKTWKEA